MRSQVAVPFVLVAFVPALAGGLNYVVQRYAVTNGFLPLAYLAPRFIILALLFAVVVRLATDWIPFTRRDLLVVVVVGGGALACNQITLVFTVRHCSASTSALLFGTLPMFVGFVSFALGRARLGRRHWAAALLSGVGVAVVAAGAHGAVAADGIGIFLGLLSALAFAAYSVCLAPLAKRYSSLQVTAVTVVAAAVPIVAVSGGEMEREQWRALGALDWLSFVYSLVVFLLGIVVLLFVVPRIGSAKMSLILNVTPFAGAVFGVILLSETMGALQIAGGVVIGCAILVTARIRAADALDALDEPALAST